MKLHSRFLLGSAIVYGALLILSIFYVAPYQPGLRGLLSTLLVDSDSEASLAFAYIYPVLWLLIPLSSIVLCILSWIAFDVNFQQEEPTLLLHGIGGLLYCLSLAPAILIVRELMIYSPIHTANVFGGPLALLTGFAGLTRSLVYPTTIARWGIVAVPIVAFLETGLFVGFFLPGDSLLFTSGLMAASGLIDLKLLIPLTILGAILGDQVGYIVGRRSGPALSRRYNLVEVELDRANRFYSKHGGKTIMVARFIPVVRTFAPVIAGAAGMRYRRFTSYNIVGGTLWVFVVTLFGYYLGQSFPRVANSLLLFGVLVVLFSVPVSVGLWLRRTRHGGVAVHETNGSVGSRLKSSFQVVQSLLTSSVLP
jgi:membrane-associated protein